MSSTKSGKSKIDHENGKIENSLNANDNWETSSLGFNSKDATDAICASTELRRKYFTGMPRFIYEEVVHEENKPKPMNKFLSNIGLVSKY